MVAKNLHSSEEVIYSTYPEFEYEYANIHEQTTLKPGDQELIISLEKRKIDGVPVTVISGFVGKRMDLIRIGDELSEVCRTDGSTRMYDIILVRDVRKRAYVYLRNSGYKVRFALEQ
jgi:translation initiation factor 1